MIEFRFDFISEVQLHLSTFMIKIYKRFDKNLCLVILLEI